MTTATRQQKKSGLLSNLLLNVAIPALILSKLSGDDALGPVWALVVALAFPLAFGLWEFKHAAKVNFFSV
ncbi:MAG TPA: MFS transporter, partial [Rheinheimera sp.]|nr:MFS transporter [Rheinheimera sp.]